MKIHLDLPWGGVFELECQPKERRPMDREKFIALVILAAWALLVALLRAALK